MKLPPKELEAFLRSPSSDINAILLYGPSHGVIEERLKVIEQNFLGKNFSELALTKLEYSTIKEQPQYLLEEISNFTFGVTKKIIIIYNIVPTIEKALKSLLKKPYKDILIIFLAEDLTPNSSFRKFFEEEKNLLAIPNYVDEIAVLKKLTVETLKANRYSFDQDFIEYFCHSLKGDRAIFKKELEKIMIFYSSSKHITLKEVVKILPQNYEDNLENFWLNLMRTDNYSHLENLIADLNSILIIRSFSNIVMKIYELKSLLAKGYMLQEAAKKLSPPIFFKNYDNYATLISKYSFEKILVILEEVLKFEKQSKISALGIDSKMLFFFSNILK